MEKTIFNNKNSLELMLKSLKKYGASDLHLNVGTEPAIRLNGKIKRLNLKILTNEDIVNMVYSILTEKQKADLEENLELDSSIEIEGVARFRINCYFERRNLAAVFRIIPSEPLTLKQLKTPEVFYKIVKRDKGLILVTGPTGSGKSTTLAAMINEINENEAKHILTIEDPIEFVHKHKKSIISQREINKDTKSFSKALRAALREDPDVILVGEMRDKETISIAITAADTGHLVLGTLHTNSASQTINRIINVFSPEEQDQIKTQLSLSLTAIISQILIPKVEGGRIAVHEILVNTPAISNLIRNNKIHQIEAQMGLNQNETGMQLQPDILIELVRKGIITKEDAIVHSNQPEELIKKLI